MDESVDEKDKDADDNYLEGIEDDEHLEDEEYNEEEYGMIQHNFFVVNIM
jgi:hypothetical protein